MPGLSFPIFRTPILKTPILWYGSTTGKQKRMRLLPRAILVMQSKRIDYIKAFGLSIDIALYK